MRNYRLNSSFELIGGFWKAETPEITFTGTLSAKNGLVELLSAPKYGPIDVSQVNESLKRLGGTSNQTSFYTVCGFTTDARCTLVNAYALRGPGLTHFPEGMQVSAEKYRASRTVMGLHLKSSESTEIDSATFYLTQIHNWLPTPWSSQLGEEFTSITVPWNPREIFSFGSLELRADISCEVAARNKGKNKKGHRIEPLPRLLISPESPQSVRWYNNVAYRIENFFSLLMGTSVSLKRIQLFIGNDHGWLVQKMRNYDEKAELQAWVRCPTHRISEALSRWLAVPLDKRPVELTLLGILRKSDVFDETEFLSLAQALEGFGRLRFAVGVAKISFAQLIAQICGLLSQELALSLLVDVDAFAKEVVHTRNFYTHLGITKGKYAVSEPKTLFLLNQRLRAFLRCVMLLDLGIREDELKDAILYQATKWR